MVFLRQILHNNKQREERMKKFLITTVVGIATTAAFGAASLRAPQIGGTATVTTPTATNTARAGTMRAQTMKTSSVSAPSVTTTQSIATPVSTETTDARIALLKGIKGFNPGKIKDTTAATNELNAIDSRIEELQSKLDQAEAAADQTAKLTDVYTKEQVEAKIDEKISAIGTSTGTKETYSKEEVNELLSEISSKLPQVDERGNINIPASNGKSQIRLLPYYLYATHTHVMLGHSMTYKLYTPHDFGIVNWPPLAPEFTSGWISDICAPYQSEPDFLACGYWNASGVGTTMTEFNVARCDKGFYLFYTTNVSGAQTSKYATYENKTETQIREYFCGTLPSDLCWISNFQTQSSMGNCTPKIFYVNMSNTLQYYFDYVSDSECHFDIGGTASGRMISFKTNAPDGKINEFVTNYCNDQSEFWCKKHSVENIANSTDRMLNIREHYHGLFSNPRLNHMSTLGEYTTYGTSENEPQSYVRTQVCGDIPETDCYVTFFLDRYLYYPDDNCNRYEVQIFKKFVPETELPTPLQY